MNPFLSAAIFVVIGFICGLMAGVPIGYRLHETDYTDEDPPDGPGDDDD